MISRSLSTSQCFSDVHGVVTGKDGYFAQVLYMLLISHSDDFGRLPGDAFTVKHAVVPTLPADQDEVALALRVLDGVHLIRWYDVDGRKFVQIEDFEEHQPGLHKRTNSKFPEPPGKSRKVPPRARALDTDSDSDSDSEQKRKEITAAERRRSSLKRFARWWDALKDKKTGQDGPTKKGKKDTQVAWLALDPSDELLEEMLTALEAQVADRAAASNHGEFYAEWCHPATWVRKERWKDDLVHTGGGHDTTVLQPRDILRKMARAIGGSRATIDLHAVDQLSFPDEHTVILRTPDAEQLQPFHEKLQEACRELAGDDVVLKIEPDEGDPA